MREEKFTPGPWSLLFNDKTKVVLEQQGVAVFVADTYAGFTKSEEEQKANAALISAAPEMYYALKHYFDLIQRADNGDILAEQKIFEDICYIEGALQKARGEE